jgi:peptidoglycan/LPS O-acetylase OafA/YrhL
VQIPQLTFLRFLAALGVVFFHFGQSTWPWSEPACLPVLQNAGLGVGFFFTLSGFLMAWVYAPQPGIHLKSYAQTRFARIYPLYLLSFLLALAAEMLIRGTRPRGLSVILQALGLHAWVPGYSLALNFPGWSVSVELFFYALFPLLLHLLRKQHWAVLVGIATALSVACFIIFLHIADWTRGIVDNTNSDFTLRFPPWQLHTFVTGMVGGILYQRGQLRLPTNWLPGTLFLLFSGFMVALAYFENPLTAHAGNGVLAPLYLVIIVCLAQDKGSIAKTLSWKPLQFLGEMSYAVYLLQAPVYIALEPLAHRSGATGLHGTWFHAYVLVLLAFSAVVYQYFERPMRQWLRPRQLPITK